MKGRYYLILLLATALLSLPGYVGFGIAGTKPTKPEIFIPNQLLIKPAQVYSVTTNVKNSFLQKYAKEIKNISFIEPLDWEVVEIYPGVNLKELKARLQQEAWVKEVGYNYIFRICQTIPTEKERIPNDNYFKYQYALKNEGKDILEPGASNNKSGKVGADIKATQGWYYATGENSEVVVAVIDTGVAANHEDLRNKVVKGYNFIAQNTNTEDDNGHGTFVASVIAAETNNGAGIAGASWQAKIMPLKALNEKGEGDSVKIALAIRHAAEQGAKVINMSFGLDIQPDNTLVEDACKYAYEKNCVLVAAAGNDGKEQVNYPAAYDKYCLAVGASDYNDQWVDFSNYGPQLDVVAPGVYIWGAFFDPTKPADLRNYKVSSLTPLSDAKMGTSCSAAFVSGAAALVFSLKPNLGPNLTPTTADIMMKLICYTADDVNKLTLPGKDNKIGYGRINLRKLLGSYPLIKKGNDQLPKS